MKNHSVSGVSVVKLLAAILLFLFSTGIATDSVTAADADSSASPALLTLSAYTNITGVSDTDAVFSYELFRSDRTATSVSGSPVSTVETSGKIIEGIGKGAKFDSITFGYPGYYYYIVRGEVPAPYFGCDATMFKMQIKVEETDGVLRVAKFTGEDMRSIEFVSDTASDGKPAVSFKGVNPEATKDTAGNYTYELYGPLSADAKANGDGTYGSKVQTVSLKKDTSSGKFYYEFDATAVNFTGTRKMAVVERCRDNGQNKVNREHTVELLISAGKDDEGKTRISWTPVICARGFTYTYQPETFTKKLQIKTKIDGEPKTPGKFTYILSNSAGETVATNTIWGETTNDWTIRFRKGGTYTYTLKARKGSAKGYTYDTTTHTIKYVVKDNKKGKLTCTATLDGKKVKASDEITVTYKHSYEVKLKAALYNSSEKIIKGGKVKLTNSDNKLITSWENSGRKHQIDGLKKDGTYTLTETKAPDDYLKAAAVSFTVENGRIKGQSDNLIRIYHKTLPQPLVLTAENLKNGIRLTWNPIADATGYIIYRGAAKISTIKKASVTAFTDSKAKTNGKSYTYTVFAIMPSESAPVSGAAESYWLKAPSIKKIGNQPEKKVKLTWSKNKNVSGYEIQYSTAKSFKAGKMTRTVTIAKKKAGSGTIKGLKKGKKYYFRIRSFIKDGAKKYYSPWSKVKSVKIKK